MNRVIPPPVPSTQLLREIVTAPDEESRRELIEEFARLHDKAYLTAAHQLCTRFRISIDYKPDIHQIVHEVALAQIQRLIEVPDTIDTITSWVGWVYARCRNAVQQFRDTPSGEARVSGQTSVLRRVRRADSYRSKLQTELGREPTDKEIIERANADLLARSSSPDKATNMLLKREDLDWSSTGATLIDSTDGGAEALDRENFKRQSLGPFAVDDDPPPPIFVLSPRESRPFLKAALMDLREHAGEPCHTIAKTWITPVLRKDGTPMDVVDVAAACHVSTADVGEAITQLRGAAIRVIAAKVRGDPELLQQLQEYAEERGL